MLQSHNESSLREENAKLKRLVSEMEETILQLQNALLPPEWSPPLELGLTNAEARIVAVLFKNKGEVASKSQIYYGMYYDKLDQPDLKIVDVIVCKVRKKLQDYGLEIKTARGVGYYFDKPSFDILKSWGIDPNESTSH